MRILLAVDGSPESEVAVRTVAERRWSDGSTVRVLTVAPNAKFFGGVEGVGIDILREQDAAAEEHARHIAERAAADLGRAGLRAETVVRRGNPRHAIVDEASEWRSHLVVLGSHGRTGLKRLLLGSVAEYVVRHATCSVEVARVPRLEVRRATRDVAQLFAPPPMRVKS